MAWSPASYACEPPLARITTVSGSCIDFHVAVKKRDLKRSHLGLEVYLWHEGTEAWHDLRLEQVQSTIDEHAETVRFHGLLHRSRRVVRFTLKVIEDGETHWINSFDPQPDGIIIFLQDSTPSPLSAYIENLNPTWKVSDILQEAKSSWILRSEVSARTSITLHLGHAFRTLKWFALVRHSTPWLGPRQGNFKFSLDKPGILASFLQDDGSHIVVVPMNGVANVLNTLGSDDAGNILVESRNDGSSESPVQVIVSRDKSFETALATALSQMRSLHPDLASESDALSKELEDWYDGFSYCTWNGLGRDLSEKNIVDALGKLEVCGVKIANLIIDDNWQTLNKGDTSDPFNYQWSSFEANKENFPKGLRHLIQRIRNERPHLRHIAVWHGIFGYWGGIDPLSDIAKRYNTRAVQRQTQECYMSGGNITVVTGEHANQMYDDFYGFLAACGVDSVKADNQYYPDYLHDSSDRVSLIYSYQDAWLAASKKHFNHRAISCMSQTPQILFHSFLDRTQRPPYLVRNSDDFFPHEPSSHSWHVFCNAHNSVLTQHLNILPDWDMFQTAGPLPGLHAAARCLSGGPIYITDVPAQHDLDLINQMTAKSIHGYLKILRPKIIGRTTEVYNPHQSSRFLRICSGHLGAGILGLFNLSDRERMELVTLNSFLDLEPAPSYLFRTHVSNQTQVVSNHKDAVVVSLEPKEYEIVTAHPIQTQAHVKFAVLGLAGKMTGVAALRDSVQSASLEDGSVVLEIELKALGILSVWVEDICESSANKRISCKVQVAGATMADLDIEATSDVLKVDLEKIWDSSSSSHPQGGVSSDISVSITIPPF